MSAMMSRYNQHKFESLLLSKAEVLGVEAVNVFVDLDKDGDLHLSLDEAETLLKHFVDVSNVRHYFCIGPILNDRLKEKILKH